MTELTANLKTRCVGRYLINMPGDAVESGHAKIQGVSIGAKAMTEEAYRKEVAQRETVLKATKSVDAYPFLYAAGQARGENTYSFIHRGTVYDDPSRRYFEGYKWDRGYRFLPKIKTYDYTHPDQTNDPIVKQFDVKNAVPEKTALVFSMLEKLRGRPEDEIPTEPGVCFAGGFLPTPEGSNESVDTQFRLHHMEDATFDIGMTPDLRETTTLLQRANSTELRAALKAADGELIRKGTVELPGLKSEEWLVEGRRPETGRRPRQLIFILH
ncbi:T6SS immunity protein Tli4 family protein [Paraburkholderia sp. BL23I1N1]|uniref:T6SS immunity protein Tli4 family protein n=1 Tax=Paraburkholderia sp. BL23I1N1 TaxID=1938802 RepID=UPI0011C3EC3B|nr:T6SS immunity protein Tli4 family protein [Paraburkholderia sp. BL23I1N1]